MIDRYDASALIDFGAGLFAAAGMPGERARLVSELLVEGDLMGHDTHGLAQAPAYLGALERGDMKPDGEPAVIADRGATLTWDGAYLSGVWLTARAIDVGLARVADHGTVSIAIRRSHHIACLAAFLPRATGRGCMVIVASSDPSEQGIPTDGDPVLIDISASATTLGLAGRLAAKGERLPHPWLIDHAGRRSDDPAVLQADPPGSILPLGGLDRGHKGFGLALMVEALTSGLAGHGRKDAPDRWGASVFVQVIDPDAFGGRAAFTAETGWLARACRAAEVAPGRPPVRLPGDGALARKRQALAEGVALYPEIMSALAPWADKLGVAPPAPLA
jgi:LDH2 family malate/lactate/ureidoglycolate dehydrogenase